jgi:hypothetical protein
MREETNVHGGLIRSGALDRKVSRLTVGLARSDESAHFRGLRQKPEGQSVKQHTGDEIRAIMTDMPTELVEKLQADHAEHQITEREARWWGYLMFARTDAYEGTEYAIPVSGGEPVTQKFLIYVLEGRAGDTRHGLVRKPWPDSGIEMCVAES